MSKNSIIDQQEDNNDFIYLSPTWHDKQIELAYNEFIKDSARGICAGIRTGRIKIFKQAMTDKEMIDMTKPKTNNYDIVIHGKTIREIIEQQLILTSDIETGHCYWITREEAKKRKEMWDAIIPKVETKGRIVFFGTGGNVPNDNMEDMFLNPQNYGIMEKGKEESKKYPSFFIPIYRGEKDKGMDGL